MTILMIIRFKVTDKRRYPLMQDAFNASRPEGSAVLAWDLSPHRILGATDWDAIGIIAFRDQDAVDAYYASAAYRNFSVMREAAGDVEVDMVLSYPQTDRELKLRNVLFQDGK